MRRWVIAWLAAVVVVGVLVTPASAGRPSAESYDWTSIDCEGELDGSPVWVWVDDSPYADVWIEGTAYGSSEGPDVAFTGDTVTTTMDMYPMDGGAPIGTATLEATFEPVGEPEPFDDRYREGNIRVREEGWVQSLAVEASLTALGSPVDLVCGGSTGEATYWATSPDATVYQNGRFLSLTCSFDLVGLYASSGGGWAFTDLYTPTAYGFSEDTILTTESYEATIELTDAQTGEPAGTATASATLSQLGHPEMERFGREKVVFTTFEVDGTVSIPGLGGFDMAGCEAREVLHSTYLRTTPHVAPPANDLPEDALPITPGDTVTLKTAGAAPEGEVTTECLDAPPGYSVWYTLEGTGSEVTIDPTGSDYDTVIAAYARDGDTWTEVACIDDDDDLQGALTLATEAGVTYWIQAGGFYADYGTLTLTVT
jgi:hypothetical protein